MMKKLFLLFCLTTASSASAEKYLISAKRISQLIKDWKNNDRVTMHAPTGVMTVKDKAGNILSHKEVGEGIFNKAEKDYSSHANPLSLEGFMDFLAQPESIDGYNQLLSEYENSFESDSLSTPAETIELTGDIEKDIKTLSTRLGLIYNAYMLVSSLNTPMVNNNNNNNRPIKQLNILIQTTDDNSVIITVNYNWKLIIDFGVKKEVPSNHHGALNFK